MHIFLLDVDVFFSAGGWWLVPCCPKDTHLYRGEGSFINVHQDRVCWKGAVHALLLMASWMIQPSIRLHLFLHFEQWFWSGNLEYLTIQGAEDNSSHYLIDPWPKSGAWILIWGLLNITTWEPKNTIQNSISIKHKVIMTQLITILLFIPGHLPSSQSHQLGGRFPCGLLILQVRLLNPRVTALVRQSGRVMLLGSSDLVDEIQVCSTEGFPFMWLHVS